MIQTDKITPPRMSRAVNNYIASVGVEVRQRKSSEKKLYKVIGVLRKY